MIVVPIVAAAGLTIRRPRRARSRRRPARPTPWRRSRRSTSTSRDAPRGRTRRRVHRLGRRVRLAPADDVIISVERPLDFDSPAQLVASILSKKVAAGSTHVVIDMPVGPTAKVRSAEAAESLDALFRKSCTPHRPARCASFRTDGTSRSGEASARRSKRATCSSVLRGEPDGPGRPPRALARAGRRGHRARRRRAAGGGHRADARLLDTGELRRSSRPSARRRAECASRAARRSQVVVVTPTRLDLSPDRQPPSRSHSRSSPALRCAPTAGLELHARLDARVDAGERLMSIHAEAPGELEYARGYLTSNPVILDVDEPTTANGQSAGERP